MRKFLISLVAVLLVLGIFSVASAKKEAKPGGIAVEVIKLEATIKAIDYVKKVVTLSSGDKVFTVNAKNARNLDQVLVGDKVVLDLIEEVAILVRKAGGSPQAGASQTVALTPKGKMPGGIVANTVEIEANVVSIDYKKHTLTVQGPQGNTRTLKVDKDVKNFKNIKKDDQVVLQITEAIALSVEKKPL